MDALRTVPALARAIAAQAATAVQELARAVVAWTVDVASRQVDSVTILGQSLTLFFLSVAITYFKRPVPRG